MEVIMKQHYRPGALRQYEVTGDIRDEQLGAGLSKVEVSARGGDMFVAVGDGPQDLSLTGVTIGAGETKTIWVHGEDIRLAARLAADAGVAVIQVVEYFKTTDEG
jgi:hypothetical protein